MIKRSTLRSQIATALRDELLAGRVPPGHQFTVKEIAEHFGVSATPVREALVDLAAQGLLDVEHHRGFRVHEFTFDDYRHMVRARTLVLDGLFHGDGPEDLLFPEHGPTTASVRRRAEAARRSAAAGDLDVLIGYDLRFWKELGGLVGNPYICEFLERLRVQCWVFTVPYLRAEHRLAGRLWSGHRDLAAAVEARDAEAARALITDYNRHALAMVEELRSRSHRLSWTGGTGEDRPAGAAGIRQE